MKPKKTFKREVAFLLLLWLAWITETKDVDTLKVLVWPVFTFAALSFGLDWFGKSGAPNGMRQPTFSSYRVRAEHSSKHTSGTDQQPDDRAV